MDLASRSQGEHRAFPVNLTAEPRLPDVRVARSQTESADTSRLRETNRFSMSDSAIYHQLRLGERRLRSNGNGLVVSENSVFDEEDFGQVLFVAAALLSESALSQTFIHPASMRRHAIR
jgi:hypothetical protein